MTTAIAKYNEQFPAVLDFPSFGVSPRWYRSCAAGGNAWYEGPSRARAFKFARKHRSAVMLDDTIVPDPRYLEDQ